MFAESIIARNHHKYLHQKSAYLIKRSSLIFHSKRTQHECGDPYKGHSNGAIIPTQPRSPRNTIPESDKDEDGRDDEEYDARNPDQVGMALGGLIWSEERHCSVVYGRARQLESNNNTRADEMRRKKKRDIQKGGFRRGIAVPISFPHDYPRVKECNRTQAPANGAAKVTRTAGQFSLIKKLPLTEFGSYV